MSQDTTFWPKINNLASCLCAQIIAAGLPEPCFCGVLPGASALSDYCTEGCGGMAWVRLVNMVEMPISIPTASGVVPSRCNTPLAAVVEVGIIRGFVPVDDQGEPRSQEDWNEAAALTFSDMSVALDAIRCCYNDTEVSIGQWQPIGPEGGCVGGAWTVTVPSA